MDWHLQDQRWGSAETTRQKLRENSSAYARQPAGNFQDNPQAGLVVCSRRVLPLGNVSSFRLLQTCL